MALVRKPAPNFEGTSWYNGDFVTTKLSDYKGKYLVLFFYPIDFTFVCPTEIIAFSNKAKEFREIGAEVVAASIDSKFSHMEYSLKPRKREAWAHLTSLFCPTSPRKSPGTTAVWSKKEKMQVWHSEPLTSLTLRELSGTFLSMTSPSAEILTST